MMFRLLLIPLIFAMLAFSLVYFVLPEFISESQIVSIVAQFTLNSSNAIFESMPAVLAKYISVLDLTMVSLTLAVITMLFVQSLVIVCSGIYYPLKWIRSILARKKIKVVIRDLPAITPDAGLYKPVRSEKILGRGFDTVERSTS